MGIGGSSPSGGATTTEAKNGRACPLQAIGRPLIESNDLVRHLAGRPDLVTASIAMLLDELHDLGAERPTAIASSFRLSVDGRQPRARGTPGLQLAEPRLGA